MTIEDGTRFTGYGPQDQLSHYTTSAGHSRGPTNVLSNSQSSLKKVDLPGLLRRLSRIAMTGSERNRGLRMESHIARGFLTLIITEDQRKRLRDLEKSLPQGRYLTGYEICRMFHLKPKTLTETQINAMQDTWAQFWKVKNNEDPQLTDQTKQVVFDAWSQYVKVGYNEPLPEVSGWQ